MSHSIGSLRKIGFGRTLKMQRKRVARQSRRFALHHLLRSNQSQLDGARSLVLQLKNAADMLLHLFKGQLIEHCLSIAVLSLAFAIPAAGGVLVVDNSRPQQGDGTFDSPFTTLAAAQA